MKKQILPVIETLGLLCLGGLLLYYPGQSMTAAKNGIYICTEFIIPSLFPFFVLSSLVIATGLAARFSKWIGWLLSPALGLEHNGIAALILGLIGGYPVGARTLAELTHRGECSNQDARRISLFCNNCGPAFLIGATGVGLFGKRETGYLLLGTNLLSALLIGGFLHLFTKRTYSGATLPCKKITHPSLFAALPDCISTSFSSTLGVCAYVILFSVIVALLDCSGIFTHTASFLSVLFPIPYAEDLFHSLLTGFLEISTGIASLKSSSCSPFALPIAAFILSWGGFSVHCQSLPFLKEANVPFLPYLIAKFTQGILSALLIAVAVTLFPSSSAVMAPTSILSRSSLLGEEVLVFWGISGIYWLKRKIGVDY